MNSLDPRVERLPKVGQPGQIIPKEPLDQFGTFEVFVQPKEGKPFQHEGIVHAPNIEMAYVLAKETLTRRFTCISLCVADTRNVFVSPITEGNINVYDVLNKLDFTPANQTSFEIYYLIKRGKQHVHAGSVNAASPEEAVLKANTELKSDKIIYNVWAIRKADIRFTNEGDEDLWLTLPDKKFRDAGDYKGGDKLKEFLERSKSR